MSWYPQTMGKLDRTTMGRGMAGGTALSNDARLNAVLTEGRNLATAPMKGEQNDLAIDPEKPSGRSRNRGAVGGAKELDGARRDTGHSGEQREGTG